MKLTGKCKEDFNDWICLTVAKCSKNICTFENFYRLNDAAKHGVFEEFFDSVGLDIEICKYPIAQQYYYLINDVDEENRMEDVYFDTRQEARTAAIKKANKLHNQR